MNCILFPRLQLRHLISLAAILIMFPVYGITANVSIQGVVKGVNSGVLRILEYADRLSYLEREITRVKIDSSGEFVVSCHVQETTPVLLVIGFYKGDLIIEPGATYDIELIMFDNPEPGRSMQSPGFIRLNFTKPEPGGLNGMVESFESRIDSFINTEYERIYLRHDKKLVLTFIDSIRTQFSMYTNPFFSTYIEYTIGYLEYSSKLRSWESIWIRYFRDRRIEYGNPAYMELLGLVFDKYFIYHSPLIELDPLIQGINEGDYANEFYMKCISDTLFSGDVTMAEMVMLLSIKSMFHEHGFSKQKVIHTLQDIKPLLRSPISKAIRINLIDKLVSMMPGIPAGEIRGEDRNHEQVQLSSFIGRRVLVVFWSSTCLSCKSDFTYMASLINNRADSLVILTVNVDGSFVEFSKAITAMPAGLEYIYLGMDYSVLDAYHVSSLPLYVLIDSAGRIQENPTVSPSNDTPLFLRKVFGIR